MRRFSQRHSMSTLSELNVTPLLDLAFVLLIIFMITTPLMEKSVDVRVPTNKAAAGAVDPSRVQNVTITKDAVIKLNSEAVTLDQLEANLAAMKQPEAEIGVEIRAHKDLPIQKLTDVISAIQRAGITKFGLVNNPEGE